MYLSLLSVLLLNSCFINSYDIRITSRISNQRSLQISHSNIFLDQSTIVSPPKVAPPKVEKPNKETTKVPSNPDIIFKENIGP